MGLRECAAVPSGALFIQPSGVLQSRHEPAVVRGWQTLRNDPLRAKAFRLAASVIARNDSRLIASQLSAHKALEKLQQVVCEGEDHRNDH